MLSQIEKENILKDFPNIKLSYENIIYKKVNSDYIVVIPKGKKYFAWFTNINDKMCCCIMELSINKQINDIKIVNTCFLNDLGYGSIIYGTIINYLNCNFFLIEDIFCYKGVMLEKINWGEKLLKINKILKNDLKQIAYNNNFLVFGLPLICKTLEEFKNKQKTITYNIESIQFLLFNKVNSYLVLPYKNYQSNIIQSKELNQVKKKEMIFLIKPDIQDDIYYLYCLNSELKEEKHSVAHIPNYNTSVLMNNLFRKIKENFNLDALEESDDDEEFENNNIDKYVYLDKSYKMVCQFNNKFKKWVPIKLANENEMIVKLNELQYFI